MVGIDELGEEGGTSNDLTFLQGKVNDLKKDLNEARRCWREEYDKRKAVEKELKGLGKGTSFLDVEKLRTDINTLELQIYHTKESIRHKTESMQEARARDNSELQEKRENLRTLKKQCEDQLKQYKKSQLDALKQKRHEMTINEELREEANMNKTDWKEEVKARTKPDEDRIPQKVEELRQEQEKNIGRFEQEIQEQQDDIDQKYGTIEEEIRKLKDTVEKKKIKLHDLEMARENRLEYNVKVEEKRIICEHHPDEATAK
jgi:chromosome segregation ATPase